MEPYLNNLTTFLHTVLLLAILFMTINNMYWDILNNVATQKWLTYMKRNNPTKINLLFKLEEPLVQLERATTTWGYLRRLTILINSFRTSTLRTQWFWRGKVLLNLQLYSNIVGDKNVNTHSNEERNQREV